MYYHFTNRTYSKLFGKFLQIESEGEDEDDIENQAMPFV
jgi:hypothetical protein